LTGASLLAVIANADDEVWLTSSGANIVIIVSTVVITTIAMNVNLL
jgi:hypothetical protein